MYGYIHRNIFNNYNNCIIIVIILEEVKNFKRAGGGTWVGFEVNDRRVERI